MRALAAPDSLLAKCHSYAPRIGNDEAFSGVTALAIWGLPTPARWLASKHTPELLVPKSHVRGHTGGRKPRRIFDARFEREEHLDYEGGHHWSNEEIIRSDLTRSRNLSSRGARHTRVSKDDLEGRAFNSLVAELRRRTASPDNS